MYKNARGHMSKAALGPQSTEKHLKPKRLSEKSQFYLLLWLRLTQTHSNSSSADDVRTSLLIMGGKQDTHGWKRKLKLIKKYSTSWWQLCGQQQKCWWWWWWRCRALLRHPQKLHYIAVHEGNLWTTQQRHWAVEDWGKIKVSWVKY